MKRNVHKSGHFQHTIHYEGKSFSCPRTQKVFTSYYIQFSYFKIRSQIFLCVSAILHHISLLRLLPKSHFKISTFQPNFLCSSSFNNSLYIPLMQKCITFFVKQKSYYFLEFSLGQSLNKTRAKSKISKICGI